MPKKSSGSSLASKYGADFNAAKANEIDYGSGGEVPAGIVMGVAQLVDCEFGQYKTGDNVGEDYFRAAGVVVHSGNSNNPTEHEGRRVVGLRTQIMEPIMDTPTRIRKEVKDHIDWVVNEFKKLGVDTDNIDFEEDGQIEAVAATLAESKPYFTFRTWKGKKATDGPYKDMEPRTIHEWGGVCEFPQNGEMRPTEDNTGEASKKSATGVKPSAKPSKKPAVASDGTDEESEPEIEVDLDALVTDCALPENNKKGIAARQKLQQLAMDAGISEKDFEEAESYEEVAGMIRLGVEDNNEPDEEDKGQTEDSSSEEGGEEEWEPAVGDIYKFAPVDPKTKKVGKAGEFEVIAVQKKGETVHLKDNVTKKTYCDSTKKPIAVKWEKLESAE